MVTIAYIVSLLKLTNEAVIPTIATRWWGLPPLGGVKGGEQSHHPDDGVEAAVEVSWLRPVLRRWLNAQRCAEAPRWRAISPPTCFFADQQHPELEQASRELAVLLVLVGWCLMLC